MFETLSFSILALFCTIVWSLSYMFYFLNKEMIELKMSAHPSSIRHKMEELRNHHVLVCELVNQTNACFGVILLVALTHGFVNFISDTFEITMSLSNSTSLETRFIIRFCQHFCLLSSICFASHRLQAEVYNRSTYYIMFV